ncbi:hypothetical protein FPI77_00530 [Klebsiella quasivariicola]|nr:hypothetical protein B8P98_15400 [Klebsiella quasivariicola]MBK2370654.1 hypothetical protein [Klebsiella quasivariicola]NBZ76309.1 hypothetical protein [Klebsiella quasivariicola]QBL49739.1 hypothetical protein BMD99_015025 [Klebsiella sp. PO552]TTN83608.1 hypothetical protein FPI77_00530 [Klebsiella quasivariicola]
MPRSIFCLVRGENGCLPRGEHHAIHSVPGADQALGKNLLENVNETHKYVFTLSTPRSTLPIILGFAFLRRFRGERECELRC